MLRACKVTYRRKLEAKLQQNNVRDVWTGMKQITGCKVSDRQSSGSLERAKELNIFFSRFSSQPSVVSPTPPDHHCPKCFHPSVGITVHIITRLLNVLQRVTVAESASCLHREITHLLL